MGMEHKVAFGPGGCPQWSDVTAALAARGLPVEMRMIDGQLAFPDETPPEEWRELRVNTNGGMITIRRDAGGVTVVTWSNADEAMRMAWDAVAEVFRT